MPCDTTLDAHRANAMQSQAAKCMTGLRCCLILANHSGEIGALASLMPVSHGIALAVPV